MDQKLIQRRRARWFFTLLCLATLLFLSAKAFGQAPAAPPAAAGAIKAEKMGANLLSKAAVTAMEQARREGVGKRDLSPQWDKFKAFEAYYKRYVFGKMKDPEFVGELGTLTQGMLEDLDRAYKAGSPAAPIIRDSMIEMAKVIAPNNYHPVARINATLMLALVDDAAEDPRNRTPPVPAAAAFLPLVQTYTRAEFPDAVRAAALQGIARHVSLNAVKNPQYRAGVAKVMLQLATSEPPAGRSPEAHAFMQRYAVDILSVLANPNASPDTTKTLVALSTDKAKPSLIATYAASKIAAIEAGKQTVEQVPTVLKTWASRAAATIDEELKRIERLDPPIAVRDQPAMPTDDTVVRNMGGYEGEYGGGGSDMQMEGYGPEMGMEEMYSDYGSDYGGEYPMAVPAAKPQPLEVITSRRRINHVLQQLLLGATGKATPGVPDKPAGLMGAAAPADKESIDGWITTINDVINKINVDTLDDRIKYVTELKAQLEVLRTLAGEDITVDPNAVAGPGGVDPLDPLNVAPAGMNPPLPGAAAEPVAAPPAAMAPPSAMAPPAVP